ncbi:aspartate-ammonia ligase [Herbinix hemicellulosilytica]|uniref:Aspartate--ammonia ligase n=1 Tax=Herbinix hemicellulosilytica TaxID=1564487 RepID=A0A0H5SHY8_HERHM|nr:aspartate--ammonia ligase [Herbinix hemicellulosilytica]RBP59592.1 aspartate-ammonia ligase [Herbinix hemicellulosilytica]CRZ34695.1 Aspartate-ammonia ligase [Herbinix hemicellulosilytica]
MKFFIPEGYKPHLDIKETEIAIKEIKDYFERELAKELNLTRVSAPLFVRANSGLNDNLNGVERPVAFDIKEQNEAMVEIVQSLAKWKRLALKRYGFEPGEGLYTDMNAIRRDEETDNIHSIFVDQWDWEKIINKNDRNEETLKQTVRLVYNALKNTEKYIAGKYDYTKEILPDEIYFIKSQELEDRYPNLTPKEREYKIAKEKGAVFIMQIGGNLASGKPHDGRSPDYDDWKLNGDIIVYYPVLDIALELSSMGIRVDEETLMEQLKERNCLERAELPFHKALLNGELPYTIGGGIGQSRICMFYLRKAHIGEVQSSVWPDEVTEEAQKRGIPLL